MKLSRKIIIQNKTYIDKETAKSILSQNNPWTYILLINQNSNNILEFAPLREYTKKRYSDKNIKIIGLANSRPESIILTLYIIETFLQSGQPLQNLKTYLWNI